MPRERTWATTEDETLRRLRSDGYPWDAIAEQMQISRRVICKRAKVIRIERKTNSTGPKPAAALSDPWRDPLPAGHTVSWGAIVSGTCLDGVEYQS